MTLSYLQQGWGTFDQAHASIFQVSEELYTFTFIVVNLIPIVEESRSRGDKPPKRPAQVHSVFPHRVSLCGETASDPSSSLRFLCPPYFL